MEPIQRLSLPTLARYHLAAKGVDDGYNEQPMRTKPNTWKSLEVRGQKEMLGSWKPEYEVQQD